MDEPILAETIMDNKTYRQFITSIWPALSLAISLLTGCSPVEPLPTALPIVVELTATPTAPADDTPTLAFTPGPPLSRHTATPTATKPASSPTSTPTPTPASFTRQGDTLPSLSSPPSPPPGTPIAAGTRAPTPTASPLAAVPTPTPAPVVSPTLPPPSLASWRGEYYNNPNLAGEPVLIRDDPTLDFNWGADSPGPNIPADNFSARWTRLFEFPEGGDYRFVADVDDGVKLYLDNWLVIDEWNTNPYVLHSGVFGDIEPGVHTLVVEYFEAAGNAHLKVWLEKTIVSGDKWVGEYYNNPDFRDAPFLVREDEDLDFDWGDDEPASGMNDDNFSVRWQRTVVLKAGDYDFEVDLAEEDRVKVFLDNWLIIEEDSENGGTVTATFKDVGAGLHTIRVEYQDYSDQASIEVDWDRDD